MELENVHPLYFRSGECDDDATEFDAVPEVLRPVSCWWKNDAQDDGEEIERITSGKEEDKRDSAVHGSADNQKKRRQERQLPRRNGD